MKLSNMEQIFKYKWLLFLKKWNIGFEIVVLNVRQNKYKFIKICDKE
jgi:hypothetical protein